MIQIRDETAGVLLLTIDNNGLICLGNGTPVSAVTVNGIAVIDGNGQITNQRAPGSALAPTTGSVTVNNGGTATVATASGRMATVHLDTDWPAQTSVYVIDNGPAHCQFTNIYTTPVLVVKTPQAGQFTVWNRNQQDDSGQCNIGDGTATGTYRWF